jgi:acetyltransferase-like isoleucine patch superfamily enzyme
MYKKLMKIKKAGYIDFSGILFHAFYLVRNFINIHLKNPIIYFICYIKGVKLGKKIIFDGLPLIRRYPNSSIIFGNGCTFNSARNSLAIGLSQPCTFVTLEENATIIFGSNSGASGLKIAARSKVTIGNNVLIGAGSIILDTDAHHSNLSKREQNIIPSRPITIEDNVFIGLECVILKGVKIGKNTVIGARSVVINSIPEDSIAIGNPCKVVFKRKSTYVNA